MGNSAKSSNNGESTGLLSLSSMKPDAAQPKLLHEDGSLRPRIHHNEEKGSNLLRIVRMKMKGSGVSKSPSAAAADVNSVKSSDESSTCLLIFE